MAILNLEAAQAALAAQPLGARLRASQDPVARTLRDDNVPLYISPSGVHLSWLRENARELSRRTRR